MKTFLLASTLWLLASVAHAATLIWDAQPNSSGPLTIERGTTQAGPFTAVAVVPTGTTQFILTPGAWGHYRVRSTDGPSNTVQFAADLYAGPVLDRLDAIEARLTALETSSDPPAPAGNITATVIDADRIEIRGANCTSLATTGTGLQRIVTCRH